MLSAPSIIEQMIAGVIVTVLAGSVGLVTGFASKTLLQDDPRNSAVESAATPTTTQNRVVTSSTTIEQPSTTIGRPTTTHSIGPPIRVLSVTIERFEGQGYTYVFPGRIDLSSAELRELNRFYGYEPAYDRWFRNRGGVDPFTSHVKVVLEGNRNSLVRVIGMRALKRCHPPLTGTIFYSPPAGAEEIEWIGFDLDSNDPNARLYDPQTSSRIGKASYFTRKTISLKPGEQQVIQIKAVTLKHYCDYRLDMAVLDGGRTVTQRIDNNGAPFQVTSAFVANERPDYSRYRAVYLGGVVSPNENGDYVRSKQSRAGK